MLNDQPEKENQNAATTKKEIGQFYSSFLFLAGIALPVLSIVIETTTHWCAEVFFDPIPTVWHVVMVVFVPVANLQVWLAIRKGETERPALLGYANAFAIAISAFYTIVYLSITPIAIVAILLIGLGFLGLTAHFSLLSALLLRRRLKMISPQQSRGAVGAKGLLIAIAAMFVVIGALEFPRTMTQIGLKMATSDSPEKQSKGIRWLRRWGNDDLLLRSCYKRSGMMGTDIIGFLATGGANFAPDKVREIYFRVNGKPFNAMPTPRRLGVGGIFDHFSDDIRFDEDGPAMLGIRRGLSLSDSKMDGSVDGDAALGYLEWTLVFKNEETWQQEAETQIQLPPDAVVSRLTLWVNGEEREAAFAARDKVTAAYNEIALKQRKDPVLVVTDGRDKIRVRCFPVQPKGEMKIRIGMTVPLMLEDTSRGIMRLPYFRQRNFSVAESFTHAVWIESKKPLEAANKSFQLDHPQENVYGVRGAVKDSELADTSAPVRAAKSNDTNAAWAKDTTRDDGMIVRQTIEEKESKGVSRLVFVIDTSQRMKEAMPQLISAIETLPQNLETSLVLAGGNGVNEDKIAPKSFTGNPQTIAATLKEAVYEGGADNVPALLTAWDVANQKPDSAIVWIHGPQPVTFTSVEELKQRWTRRPTSAPVYTLQLVNGVNRIEEAFDDMETLRTVKRFGDLRENLERLLAELGQKQKKIEVVRTAGKQDELKLSANAKETSNHLVRLWANDEVARILLERKPERDKEAQTIAARYQLVTPVSGAVVLETAEQYKQTGLKPVDPATVPTIPEPETYLLIAIASLILFGLFIRQRLS